MKLIFLDVDGVLNSWAFWDRRAETGAPRGLYDGNLDEDAIERLNWIVEQTGARVVISSTWRKMFSPSYMERILTKYGFRGVVVGATPVLYDRTKGLDGRWIDRGYEIDVWLTALGDLVESYVIIDDDGDMTDAQMANFVQTRFETGLTDEDADRAVEILGRCA